MGHPLIMYVEINNKGQNIEALFEVNYAIFDAALMKQDSNLTLFRLE